MEKTIGTRKWVFVDWVGIDPGYGTRRDGELSDGFCVPEGLTLKPHRPYVDTAMVIQPDRPWEKQILAYATFMKDGDMCRCWYECKGGLGYAESSDGVAWHKPVIGLREFEGSKKNNLCNITMHGHGILLDVDAPSDERYKMVGCHYTEDEKCVVGAVSADGVNWRRLDGPLVAHPQEADTQNVLEYDKHARKYVLYTRNRGFPETYRRGVSRTESERFESFPQTETILLNNPQDPPDWDIYCSGYSSWPGADAAVMKLSMYQRTSDSMSVHLATSRDGRNWYRPLGNIAWYPDQAIFGSQTYQSVYACSGIIPNGDGTWSVYFRVSDMGHNEPGKGDRARTGVLRGLLREDGFVSLSAEAHGSFCTVPFVLRSPLINVNASTSYSGYVSCEVLGEGNSDRVLGQPLKGYSRTESDSITGSHTSIPLTWNGRADMASLIGRKIRLRFTMYKADLYSVSFNS